MTHDIPEARLDDEQLFAQDARRLEAVVARRVRTSPANVDDACGFAWLQFVRHRPTRAVAFAWLCTTAVREAIKLDRQMARAVRFDHAVELAANPVVGPEGRLELIAAGEVLRAAQLRRREARVLGLRAAGYSRKEIAEQTGTPTGPSIASSAGRDASSGVLTGDRRGRVRT